MATWPETLPALGEENYQIEPVDPVARTQMEAGPVRARRRLTVFPTHVTVTWYFTQAQLAIFETFHHATLSDGAAWFTLPMLNGQGVTAVDARFAEMWKARLAAPGQWDVSAKIEIRNRPIA